jgi:hypothetical protein
MPYKARIFKKWLLVCFGLLAAALAIAWLQGVVSTAYAAGQNESQLIFDTESGDSTAYPPNSYYSQTISTSTQWEAIDTYISFKIKNLESSPVDIYFGLAFNLWASVYGDGVPHTLAAYETKTLTWFIPAAQVQTALIDHDWNSQPVRDITLYPYPAALIHVLGSADPNSYPAGAFYKCRTYQTCYPVSSDYVADAYFRIAAYSDFIEITFPENATTTPDFAAWKTNFSIKDTPPVYGSLKLNYGLSSSTLTSFDLLNFEAYDNESAPANIPKALLLLPYTTYYAQANILDASSTVIATSTLIYFTTAGVGEFYENNYYAIPTSTIATSTPIQITCDPDDPWYTYSLCKLAVWLFVPSPATLNQFSTLGDTLKNKPPMGYFYRVKDALVFSATSTPAFNLENASTTLAASIYNPLKSGITFLLWLAFGFWIFNRIRHLDL